VDSGNGRTPGCPYALISAFDEFLIDDVRKDVFLEINRKVICDVRRIGDMIPLSTLKEIDAKRIEWVVSFESRFLETVAQQIERLLNGKGASKRIRACQQAELAPGSQMMELGCNLER